LIINSRVFFAIFLTVLLIPLLNSAAGNVRPLLSAFSEPILKDPNLKVEKVIEGLEFPTSMAILDHEDMLVLEKNQGTVKRIINGTLLQEPLLDVAVATQGERGMLGIATSDNKKENVTFVFLYFTKAKNEEGKDVCPNERGVFPYCNPAEDPVGNQIYRYEFDQTRLVNPKLLLDLPASPNRHNGGPLLSGPDGNLYILIGDIHRSTKAQNFLNGSEPDGTSGILRITPDGAAVPNGSIIGDQYPLNLYYAYGIRNSFGMDFDPLTGNLWDTENGLLYGDEINLVEPGFNSGWSRIQGIWDSNQFGNESRELYWQLNQNRSKDIVVVEPRGLVDFDGKGNYSNPELTWRFSVAPTAIKFLESDKLGKQYQNDMFVGDFRNGNIYHFKLNKDRTQLSLNGSLADKIVDNEEELTKSDIIFGQGFGAITDLEVGPDGYLYVLSLYQGGWDCRLTNKNCIPYDLTVGGAIFKITPAKDAIG
jgi:glucose/arabinose dehydrogenase